MLKHLLVPLDGSLLSEQALDYAIELLEKGSKVILLSVIELPPSYDFILGDIPISMTTTQFDKDQQQQNHQRVNDYLQSKAQDFLKKGIKVECMVESGDPALTITDIAEHKSVDAIAMTTHGRTGFNRWLFGSITQKVISAMPCPVLVVPDKARNKVTQKQMIDTSQTSPA